MKQSTQTAVHVSVKDQRMRVVLGDRLLREFPVSTSRFGLGFKSGSMKTPLGLFRIAEKIGMNAPLGTVFKSRKPVAFSEIHTTDDDLILSRILWLDGLGVRNSNSYWRFIYIHGTNQEDKIGTPASHGCVRMKNADVAELFELVHVGTPVVIARRFDRKAPAAGRRKALRLRTEAPK